MPIAGSLREIIQSDVPISYERIAMHIDVDWIETAIRETGTASIRRRRLPAQLLVWLVLGMALFRDRSIHEVVTHLGIALPARKNDSSSAGRGVAPSSISQARYKMGSEPIKRLFEVIGDNWGTAAADHDRWRGLTIYGIDGTTLRVPDTDDNREEFGLPPTGRAQPGYPQVRIVTLMALRSHIVVAAAFGPCVGKHKGETSLAAELWGKLPENSLVIVDRNFMNYGVLYLHSHSGDETGAGRRHWLMRAKKNTVWRTLKKLGPGDELIELPISKRARAKDASIPKTMVARAVRYQVKGYQPQVLLTSMIDPILYPRRELTAMYHERWELEVGYDEAKTHMLEREESLRSKKADGVRQEIWGILIVYNLIRKEMREVAMAAGVPPVRVSFRHSLNLIRLFCMADAWICAPGNIPKRLASHLDTMATLLILPERRSERRYERHVKIKMSPYRRNPGRPAVQGAASASWGAKGPK